MNSIEDIAKMAIEEVGAELKELENSRIPTKAPKPLRAANDTLNAAIKNDEAAQLNAASVMKENENTLNITNTNSKTFGAEIRVFGEAQAGEARAKDTSTDLPDSIEKMEFAGLDATPNEQDKNFLANATLAANAAIGIAALNSIDSTQNTSANSEKEYLLALKERLEVLFAGLKNSEGNLSLRLDLTIRFLEFLLANTNERLTKLPK
ncbi:CiaD-like domain-containing protein [Campylobacter sp.]|uniref:CiaD-like domain-containing protein n=1 Tax=Campylobacter sp. TaxID=205 RepID=UPI002A572F4C|nr:hypothetical protein [Campylobacter sp.]MDD7091554.1 hypothetical protein [Campylobacteraceae bacterium]MDY5285259.1 hypothetical protein [Campylobacter sp.]